MNERIIKDGCDGYIREVTIIEQLKRNINFRGINDIKHPVHGIIDVDRDKLEDLLKFTEEELRDMSPEEFM